jgi:hypothetical protein
VVEHLLAKEDVASSSLVTRSSLRMERRDRRRLSAVAIRASATMAKEDLTLRATAGRPAFEFNALRLFTDITVPAGSTVCGLDRQSQKTVYGPQLGRLTAHSKIPSMGARCLFCFCKRKASNRFSEISKVGLRKGIRQAAFSLMSFGAQRQAQAVRRSHSTVSDGPRSKLRLAPSR